MYAAIFRYRDGGTVEAVESSLLGTLMVAPYLRLGTNVANLRPDHFSTPNNAAIFRSVMGLRRPESVLVLADLDKNGPPVGATGGWATLLSEALSDVLVDDEAVEDAATVIKEAAAKRAREARARRLL